MPVCSLLSLSLRLFNQIAFELHACILETCFLIIQRLGNLCFGEHLFFTVSVCVVVEGFAISTIHVGN